MLTRLISIALVTYYLLATFCLPQGDFSTIQDLPEMYAHCKATEDKDMTVFDFVTDHLINVDCLFDKHEKNDPQKPHAPIQLHHQYVYYCTSLKEFKIEECYGSFIGKVVIPARQNLYLSDYSFSFLKPPIV